MNYFIWVTMHKKWSFLLRVSYVNLNNTAVFCSAILQRNHSTLDQKDSWHKILKNLWIFIVCGQGVSTCRGGSRAAATSKMEHFVIIVNGWKPLTVITKRSILDVAATLDPPLIYTRRSQWFSSKTFLAG